jgi:hypothetical protein
MFSVVKLNVVIPRVIALFLRILLFMIASSCVIKLIRNLAIYIIYKEKSFAQDKSNLFLISILKHRKNNNSVNNKDN